MTRKAPQVMVKVSGRSSGAAHVKKHFTYIGRHGQVELETSDGEKLTEGKDLELLAEDWDVANLERNRPKHTALTMVLSMPEGTDPNALHDAARAFAHGQFYGKHDYIMGLHTDTPRPHVHLTVRIQGLDGRRFHPGPAELQEMREAFALELRARGIDADAAPRIARGQTRENDRTPVYRARAKAKNKNEPFERDEKIAREGKRVATCAIVSPFSARTAKTLRRKSDE